MYHNVSATVFSGFPKEPLDGSNKHSKYRNEYNLGTKDWKGKIKLFLKKITLNIPKVIDFIGCFEFIWWRFLWCFSDWCYLNNIFAFLERLVWSTIKLWKWFPRLNPFNALINKGHLREGRRIQQPKRVTTKNNNEDNSPKNHSQNIDTSESKKLKKTATAFHFIREIWFQYDRHPVNSSLHLTCTLFDIALSRWDITTEIRELVYKFQSCHLLMAPYFEFVSSLMPLACFMGFGFGWCIFGFGWCIFEKLWTISVVCIYYCFCGISLASCFILWVRPFSFIRSTDV